MAGSSRIRTASRSAPIRTSTPVPPGEAVYVADSNDDCIQEFTPAGTWVANIGSPGDDTQPGTFTQLRRVAVDGAGNVWGADLWGYRVEEFTRSPGGYT